jgi:hypothetical protein
MDQVLDVEDSRPPARRAHRRRALVAAGPIAALTAAAAAAAVTFLPHDPKPNQVSTADPGVTAPAPPSPDGPPGTDVAPPASTPTTITSAPWLPAGTPSPSTPPTTAAARHVAPNGPATGNNAHPATTEAPRPAPTTVVVSPTTTVPPATESMTLHCTTSMPSGSPAVSCSWSANTSAGFRWYRLWRQSASASPAVVFQSDNRSTTAYVDHQVQAAGTRYYYKVDVVDAAGNVLAYSPVVPVTCC